MFDARLVSLSEAPGCFSIHPALAGSKGARCRDPNTRQVKQEKGHREGGGFGELERCIARHRTGEELQ